MAEDPGQDRVVPYLFAHPGLTGGEAPGNPGRHPRPRRPLRLRHDDPDRAGHLGSRPGRRRRCADRRRPGRRRCPVPPTRARALPATTSRDRRSAAPATSPTPPSPPRGLRESAEGPVAVIDLDAHHGNGTQAIFYRDPEVLTGFGPRRSRRRAGFRISSASHPSAAPATRRAPTATCRWHRDPATNPGSRRSTSSTGWARDGGGAGGGRRPRGRCGRRATRRARCGVAGLRVSGRRDERSAASGCRRVVDQEGGYDLETIGGLVVAALEGLEQGLGA